jgi:transposase
VTVPALTKIAAKYRERNDAAYAAGAYSHREIAAYYGLHLATMGRIIRGKILQ